MAEEPDLLSQLRSLGDPDEPRDPRAELDALDDAAPAGLSETARQLEGEGYFGALSFAALIVDLIGSDRLDHFLELVRLAAEPDYYEIL